MEIEFINHSIKGLFQIKQPVFEDYRGAFSCGWDRVLFDEYQISFVADNLCHSFNRKKDTLRAFHFQEFPFGQQKLVTCISGRVLDVAVDIDPNSPTFLSHSIVELSALNGVSHLIPQSCAHGFLTLDDHSTVSYLIQGDYRPDKTRVVRWNDPQLSIPWPDTAVPILSEKDANAPYLSEL